jgi:hypothetical protein
VAIPEDVKEENEDDKEVVVVEKNLKFDTSSMRIKFNFFP